jgi:hypothetical protein
MFRRPSARLPFALFLALFLAPAASPVHAQDANYWSTAFGTRSQLLGGVVIGSPGDISSTFYNPGALALTQSSELLLAGSAYQYQRVEVQNGGGPGKPLVSASILTVPSLFAGELPLLKHDRLAYAFLTRASMNMEINNRSTFGLESLAPIPGAQFAAGEVQLKQDFTESWYGLTYAHQLSPHLGFGVSPFVVVRSQRTRAALLLEGQDASGQAAIVSQSREFDYMHWSLLARFGLGGVRDSLTYGVTLTTPNLGLMGGGSTNYNNTLIDQSGGFGNVIGADYTPDLKAKHRTPLGAGAGASYGAGATRVHAAIDWNGEVSRYTVLESPEFVVHKPSGDSTVKVVISDRMDAVFNWGVGLEHRFSPKLSGFASYHTDLSGRKQGETPSASITAWDLKDVAAGVTWHVLRSDFALGLTTAFGNQPTPSVPGPSEGAPAPQDLQTHEMLVTVSLGWKITY